MTKADVLPSLNGRKEIIHSGFRLSEKGLSPVNTPTRDEWLECGRFLRHAEASVHFWIGDWAHYGDLHFKEDYHTLEELTGFDYDTLRRDKYTCERIPFERRRSNLDIAIHHEVAPLTEAQQEYVFAETEQSGLTVQQVRMLKHKLMLEASRPSFTFPVEGLHLGDCLKVLVALPNASIDCLLTDPPYGINYQSEHKTLPDAPLVNDGLEESLAVLDASLSILVKKLKPQSHVYIFTSWKTDGYVKPVVAKYFDLKNVLVWDKGNWTAGDLEANYGQIHEFLLFAHHKGRRHLNGTRDASILHFPRVPENEPNRHPTQKPLALLEYLIEKSTQSGEIICDPFMGSGSTCLAAKNTNRRYVGVEIDKKWYDIALSRLT